MKSKNAGFRLALMLNALSTLPIGKRTEILLNKYNTPLCPPFGGIGRCPQYMYPQSQSNRSSPKGHRARRRSFKANQRAGL